MTPVRELGVDRPDPRDVRVAHVLKSGQPAATLTRVDGAVEFTYSPAYLDSGGRAVATTLPLGGPDLRRALHSALSGHETFALPLAGRRDNLSAKGFHQFGAELGLPEPAVGRVLAEVLTITADVIEQVRDGAVPWDTRRRRDLVRTLERRRRDLQG